MIFFALAGAGLAAHESTVRWVPLTQGTRVTAGVVLLIAAIAPALVFASQRQLNDARDALRANNCARAIDRAADSIDSLSIRPEPYEVLALCQARRGQLGLAIAAVHQAISHEPDNWRYHYDLGVLLGAAGREARPELERAQQLNPYALGLADLLKTLPKGEAVNWSLELEGPSGAILKTG
jgi:tetratricopeptide (TPR) repeat protein